MIEFNAIALLRRRAATSCQLALEENQRFLEMRESDKARLVQAYRANGMSGKPEPSRPASGCASAPPIARAIAVTASA